MKVTLGSNDYALDKGSKVGWSYAQPLSDAFRLSGVPLRSDNKLLARFVYANWANTGLGCLRLRRERVDEHGHRGAQHVGGMRDSDAETRHDSVISLPLLNETQTHAAPADFFRGAVNLNGTLIGVFEELYNSGDTTVIVARTFSSSTDTWGNGATIDTDTTTAGGRRISDAIWHKGAMWVASNLDSGTGELQAEIWRGTDSTTWATASGTGWPTDSWWASTTYTRRNTFTDRPYRLLDVGNTILAIFGGGVWAAGGAVKVYQSTDNGANWSAVTTTDITTGQSIGAAVMFNDPFTAGAPLVPCVVTAEGVWKIDISGTSAQKFPGIELGGSEFDGWNAVVGADGALYIPKQSGDILRVYVPEQGVVQVTNIGPESVSHGESGDGLVTERKGHATSLVGTDPRWLYVAYGGHAASKNASILAYAYETGAWHSVYKDSTANRDLYAIFVSSLGGDAVPRLHAATEGASASVNYHFENHTASPISGATQNYKASGYVDFAEDDLGDPHQGSGLFLALIDAVDLSADDTGEYVELEYGVNGAAWNNVSNLGNFVSGDLKLYFGLTNQNVTGQTEAGTASGVSATTARFRLSLNRDGGDTTQTPKIRDFEIQALSSQQVLRQVVLPISLEATKELFGTDQETAIANLETVASSATATSLSIGGLAAVQVKMFEPPVLNLMLKEAGGGDGRALGQLTGTVTVVLTQVLEGV